MLRPVAIMTFALVWAGTGSVWMALWGALIGQFVANILTDTPG